MTEPRGWMSAPLAAPLAALIAVLVEEYLVDQDNVYKHEEPADDPPGAEIVAADHP